MDHFGKVTYSYVRKTREIYALQPDVKGRKITDAPGDDLFFKTHPGQLRASPGETYLAYIVYYQPRILSPAGKDAVRVVDIASGKDREVCRFRYVGAMLWSADGSKLYLAVGDDFAPGGVYIVDIDKAFKRKRD
jgi:hypothetical protein